MANRQVVLHTIVFETPFVWKRIKPRSKGESFVGVCEQLGITAEGDTQEELQTAAQEAMDLLFSSLAKHGDATNFLTKRNIPHRIETRVLHKDLKLGGDEFVLPPRGVIQTTTQESVTASL